MESVKSVQERRKQTLINLNAVWIYGRKGTMDVMFIVKRMQEEYQTKDKKLCFVHME